MTDAKPVASSVPPAIAMVQQDFIVGDISGNAQRIVQAARAAYHQGARVVLTPELALCGYASDDLLLRPEYLRQCAQALSSICTELQEISDLVVVAGHPQAVQERSDCGHSARQYNMASVLRGGQVVAQYAKQRLISGQVSDGDRYFVSGNGSCVFEHLGIRFGLLTGEDAWQPQFALNARSAGAQVLLVLGASPFHVDTGQERVQQLAVTAEAAGLPLVYAHAVGGQDELVFDGASFALHADGSVAMQAAAFAAALPLVQIVQAVRRNTAGENSDAVRLKQGNSAAPMEPMEQIWRALVMATGDYVRKNGFQRVVLGLSGGLDSAVVMAIALDALGADAIHAIMMPSVFTADISRSDAADMAQRTGVRYDVIPIAGAAGVSGGADSGILGRFTAALAEVFAQQPTNEQPANGSAGLAEENLQARIRGALLMAVSNQLGGLVLTTGNKSEIAVGYCTLYGDMNGAYAPIKDVLKTQVYALARWRNRNNPFGTAAQPIPERIITRPPSAELRADQTDQDSLPDYEVLDGIVQQWVERNRSRRDIVAAGYRTEDVDLVLRLIRISEYKRAQSATGPRISRRAFGRDWRYPLTSAFRCGQQL